MKKCAVGAKVEHVGETVMNRYCAVIVIKVPTRLTPSELGFTMQCIFHKLIFKAC